MPTTIDVNAGGVFAAGPPHPDAASATLESFRASTRELPIAWTERVGSLSRTATSSPLEDDQQGMKSSVRKTSLSDQLAAILSAVSPIIVAARKTVRAVAPEAEEVLCQSQRPREAFALAEGR